MSGMLATGAGAAEGLDTLLARYLAEEKQHEVERANQADEGYRNRALDENVASRNQTAQMAHLDRQAATAALTQSRADAEHDKGVAQTQSVLKMRPMGTEVDEPTYKKEIDTGAPPDFYEKGTAYPADFVGPTQIPKDTPVIKFRGTSEQQNQQARIDQGDARAAAAEAAANERAGNAERTYKLATDRLQLSRDKEDREANTVKVGEGGKRSLRSIDQAAPLISKVKQMIKQEAPDIETAPDKYNTIGNRAHRFLDMAKYKLGFSDETSPRIQLTKLLQPIQASQYLAGSRNWQMVELALSHLADPNQTLARQWEALTQLESVMPELKQAVIDSEKPVKIGKDGKPVSSGGSTSIPATGDLEWDPATGDFKKPGGN